MTAKRERENETGWGGGCKRKREPSTRRWLELSFSKSQAREGGHAERVICEAIHVAVKAESIILGSAPL